MEINKTSIISRHSKVLADFMTPVGIYLKVRDRFNQAFLLESSDYHGQEHSFSYICFDPISTFSFDGAKVRIAGDIQSEDKLPGSKKEVLDLLKSFAGSFNSQDENDFKFVTNGLFGYMSYDTVQYFEDIDFNQDKRSSFNIPLLHYSVFRFVIAFDHFRNEVYLFQHSISDDEPDRLPELINLVQKQNVPSFDFQTVDKEVSNFDDQSFKEIVLKGIDHCNLGDVFQIVLSRRFEQAFRGDEFQVYRALRSINPSPYLFYFDYGNYKIFGSSPEAQILIRDREATIFPIAGTFRRTGDDIADAELAKKLYDDPKENSEHVMLVDLARNDLSHKSDNVDVKTFKEIQYYSHVIHLVSRVTGQLRDDADNLDMVASTFPAGTLSGAPKHNAMSLIDRYETIKRGFYGGAIGFIGFNGDFNHAIMIRSFLSQRNKLHYQAGAGVVAKSDPDSEVQEVFNKIGALRSAIAYAGEI